MSSIVSRIVSIVFSRSAPSSISRNNSVTLTPSACSSSSARPVRRATDFTESLSINNSWAVSPILLLVASDDPGASKAFTCTAPSLNGGKKSLSSLVTAKNANATMTPATPRTGPGNRVLNPMASPAMPLSPSSKRPSSASSPPSIHSMISNKTQIAGVNTIVHQIGSPGSSNGRCKM